MEIIYVGKKNPSNRALLISNEEWKRLGKILTKKMDDEDEAKASKRLKDVRREMSKKMVDGWDNTELNKTKRILEQKREAISKLEAKRLQRDEEMKREAQEARDRILERARKLKFEERDETKTFNRAIQHCEVFRERAIQLKFNEAERERKMKQDLATAREQNGEAERYRNDRMDRKRQNDELKKANAKTLLKELKDREDKRRAEKIVCHESGEAELRKIAEEIEEDRRKTVARTRAVKEKLQKDVADNRELIAKNDEMRRVNEWEEEMTIAIMAETKKILARARKLKEIELAEVKRSATEAMKTRVAVWPTREIGWAKSDVWNAIKAQEQRYQDGRREKMEQAKRRAEYVDSGVRLQNKTIASRQLWLAQERKQEAERRNREKTLLAKFVELRRKKQLKNAEEFRMQLDEQCMDKVAVLAMDKQADINRYEAFKQRWHKEDEQFMIYAINAIQEKKATGAPIVLLLKTVNDYLEKNNLCLHPDGKVSKKTAKGPIYTSRIIRLADEKNTCVKDKS